MKDLVNQKKAQIIEQFETQSGITGLEFTLVEQKDYRRNSYYLLVAQVPTSFLGIMGNNIKELSVEVQLVESERTPDSLFFLAKFQYEHKDGGSNGMNVMNQNGKERVQGLV